MSKSAGNVIDPMELAEKFGVDQLRYFLLREVSFGQDGSYSEEAIVTRCNADLANNFGNLAQRSLSMIAKNCDGKVPVPSKPEPADQGLVDAINTARSSVEKAMAELALHSSIEAIWTAMSAANLYFAEQAPWSVRKEDPMRADTILYNTANAIRQLAILAQWVIPEGANKVLDFLAQKENKRNFNDLNDALESGLSLPPPQGVFPRLELGN